MARKITFSNPTMQRQEFFYRRQGLMEAFKIQVPADGTKALDISAWQHDEVVDLINQLRKKGFREPGEVKTRVNVLYRIDGDINQDKTNVQAEINDGALGKDATQDLMTAAQAGANPTVLDKLVGDGVSGAVNVHDVSILEGEGANAKPIATAKKGK